MKNEDVEMKFGGHLEELRGRIIKSIIAVMVFSLIAFALRERVADIIFAPIQPNFPINRWLNSLFDYLSMSELSINLKPIEVINTKMSGQFALHVKSSLFAGLICAMPYVIWQLWAFVRPSITPIHQRRLSIVTIQTSIFFFFGLCFGYLLISPLAINFLSGYIFSSNISNYIEVGSYISTITNISLAAAFIFLLPHFIYALACLGVVTSAMLKNYRRLSFVIIVIISAVITPPDVFSQFMIAVPFYGLYECGILVAKSVESNK